MNRHSHLNQRSYIKTEPVSSDLSASQSLGSPRVMYLFLHWMDALISVLVESAAHYGTRQMLFCGVMKGPQYIYFFLWTAFI